MFRLPGDLLYEQGALVPVGRQLRAVLEAGVVDKQLRFEGAQAGQLGKEIGGGVRGVFGPSESLGMIVFPDGEALVGIVESEGRTS